MSKIITIQGKKIEYDFEETSKHYLKEMNIIEDCPCEDCFFFVTNVTKMEFEIFQILKNVGVNLEKNLKSEPTGVWCIRNDENQLIFFQQVYLVKGKINEIEENSFTYEKEEFGFSVKAVFSKESSNDILIDLQIGLLNK